MKKFIKQTLAYSVLSMFVFTPVAFANNIDMAINQTQQTNVSPEENKNESTASYYTVKDFASLRNTIDTAKSGDIIILVGDDKIGSANDSLTIRGKELTIVSNNRSRRIDINSITVENGTLNLGVEGAKSSSELHVTSKFILSNSSLNLYDGAYIDNFNKYDSCLIDAQNTDSKINLYGGAIQNNSFIQLIKNGKLTTLTIDGAKIENNKVIRRHGYTGGSGSCHHYDKDIDQNAGHFVDIKKFILKSGFIEKHYIWHVNYKCGLYDDPHNSSIGETIRAEGTTILGGKLKPQIQTKTANISGNPSIDNLSCDSASISGGTFGTLTAKDVSIAGGDFKNVSANKISLSGKVNIDKLVSNKITVSDKLDEDSNITVSYDNYKINGQQKVFDVSNGINPKDVFYHLKLSNGAYFVNNKGYVDDTPSYRYEFTDDSTGIKIESDDNITLCNVKHTEEPNVATFTISQPNDTDKDSVHHLNFYANGKLAKSGDINKVAIYVPHTASKLDLNKLNGVKIYDSNNEEITNCKKTIKAIDGKLYTLITIDNK